MTETNLIETRQQVVQYLETQLVGPAGGTEEELHDPPDRRYLMGTLYPRSQDFAGYLQREGEEPDEEGSDSDQVPDDPVTVANEWLPASLGVSFSTDASRLIVRCSGARYVTTRNDGGRRWRRTPLATEPLTVEVPEGSAEFVEPILGGAGELFVRWRKYADGHLITVTLVNAAEAVEGEETDWDRMLFQVGLTVEAVDGEILEYPNFRMVARDDEEEELRLIYLHARVYAVGHGCGADWEAAEDGRIVRVVCRLMPYHEVPDVSATAFSTGRALSVARLADPATAAEEVVEDLREFVAGYEEWVGQREVEAAAMVGRPAEAADRIVARLHRAVHRMHRGLDHLAHGGEVLEAFRLANLAMLMQMRHGAKELAGVRRDRSEPAADSGDYLALPNQWYPFQLAFVLLTLPSVIDPSDEDRETVDLLWFPTGGGKTEAYLAVAALEIFHRRLRHAERGGGTAVISRYTLSLLTAQQFQRAARLICAAEVLRDADPARLGSEPITIGLWVGESTSPNTFEGAQQERLKLLESVEPNEVFQLDRCPWCGTAITPPERDVEQAYGVRADGSSFSFFCPSTACRFHEELPISVVDDDLYRRPPTFLIATVDKFTMLAWQSRAGVFFGDRGRCLRPSLIIQDELHLLSGPLGTTVGLYESAVQALCGWDGTSVKVICSTATIRRAGEQVRGLYGRAVRLFPPAGLDSRHSYFAEVDRERPGRFYLGVMTQGHTASTATVHLGAALLQASLELDPLDEVSRDAYWTLVVYHNSLRELGRTVTVARDDIPARLEYIASDDTNHRLTRDEDVIELTSNVERFEQPRLLERLNLPASNPQAVSFLASTNMLSVGVDVPRLGLMLINGQPKSTSEYIQASSRVGRNMIPGLVITMLRSTRPRDRSHYEGFRAYHSALYRYVEPTSVTPYSPPSRNRALHAALVILARHGVGLREDQQAHLAEDRRAELDNAVQILTRVAVSSDPSEAGAVRRSLEQCVDDWVTRAKTASRAGRVLHYRSQGRQYPGLLRQFGKRGDGWQTLQSMRNVDNECLVSVIDRSPR